MIILGIVVIGIIVLIILSYIFYDSKEYKDWDKNNDI